MAANPEALERARTLFQAGKQNFESGRYRESVECLEKSAALVERGGKLGGEVQIWLVTAYEAAGQTDMAIALCEQLVRHPDVKTRKQSRRLQAILTAPRLRTRPEWLTQIPDLGGLETASAEDQKAYAVPNRPKPSRPKPRPSPDPEPIDLSQVNTKDNSFVWLSLGAIALIVAGLLWFGYA
ncbi:hypothetical protein [Thermoleptolyngbya sp. C42_A2020_037]|uniref:hypothetical protein n=1 Tax=Thermoleptolyngbya sp. C42_A2020_037 TaxID=2747799 RepID=UPI0019E38734|nr:hypothetical protein [Thermoleptolyngbya sp. C42_A2020_037]MBF2083047.1 hypothetical protein [Thermoleptolyngbya sp. C42_A2020_037]